MINNDLNKRLKQLNTEDKIWILYIGIIIISFYSNNLERKYFINNDYKSKKKYKTLTTLIFVILIIVYLYFLKDSIDSIRELKPTDSNKKKELVYLSFIGSLLIAISGFIFLYISIVDKNLTVEIAFN
ncbi:MAG: hypothetical protein IKO49_08235 [Bacilli bacterium]|nr:hypothetical protein [Bacilli bacterium]